MKILYVYDKMPQTYQTYMTLLLETLKKNVNVKVLTYDNNPKADYRLPNNSFKYKLQKLLYYLKVTNFALPDNALMATYDIVHLQHSFLYPKCNYYFSHGIKRPKIVVTLRGGDTYIKPWIFPWWKEFFEVKSAFVDAFITVSEHQKEYLQKWGVSKDKIHIIPVSFGCKSLVKPKYPSEKTIKIVSAFRMCWEKNIEGNLRVAKTLKEKGYHVQYHIYGDGPDKGQVPYLIDKYNIQEQVTYKGKVSNEIFKEKLTDYDFFLQLSHSEAFGASVIEAQSMGIPTIISNSDGLPETIIDTKSGFCVESYDTLSAANYIEDLFKNREKYYSFSNVAIKNCNDKFTITNEIEKLKTLYKSLMSV